MVYLPDGDTDFFTIVAGDLQGDTLMWYMFILCLDKLLQESLNLTKENCFTLKKERSRQ